MTPRRRRDFFDAFSTSQRRYRKRPDDPYWALAAIPTTGRTALVVDRFNSRSESGDHITTQYSAEALGLPVAAFTFNPAGAASHYLPVDTHQPLNDLTGLFAAYLPSTETHVVLPVGASGGAAVALLGTAAWIRSTTTLPLSGFARCVPGLVLVAPAISPTPALFDRFYEHSLEQVPPEAIAIPRGIPELCDVGSDEWLGAQKLLAQAFALVRWAGIPVHVVYWAEDIVAPYPWHPDLQSLADQAVTPVRLSPADLTLLRRTDPNFEYEAARLHAAFCTHQQTIAQVRRLLAISSDIPLETSVRNL
jgi:hypothetical protein